GLLPVAAFWAGWEVSGRPPGPINAMGMLSGGFRPETWAFGPQKESPSAPALPPPARALALLHWGVRSGLRSKRNGPVDHFERRTPRAQASGRVAIAKRPQARRPERRGKLRNQRLDPVGQGEGGGVDGRVVVVRFQLGLLASLGSLGDAGRCSERFAA